MQRQPFLLFITLLMCVGIATPLDAGLNQPERTLIFLIEQNGWMSEFLRDILYFSGRTSLAHLKQSGPALGQEGTFSFYMSSVKDEIDRRTQLTAYERAALRKISDHDMARVFIDNIRSECGRRSIMELEAYGPLPERCTRCHRLLAEIGVTMNNIEEDEGATFNPGAQPSAPYFSYEDEGQ